MAQFIVTTTGTLGSVVIEDIGVSLTHPETVDLLGPPNDLDIGDLSNSSDLQEFLDSGDITATDGTNVISTMNLINISSTITQLESSINTDSDLGTEQLRITSELSVGTVNSPRESVFGEGDSVDDNILVYTYDGATYTDVSSNAKDTVSTFTFTNNLTTNYIYVSYDELVDSDYYQFQGLKVIMDTNTDTVPSSGYITLEYWNGSAWTPLPNMLSKARNGFHTFRYVNFDHSTETEYQLRFDSDLPSNWVKNDDPATGTPRYWVRFVEDRSGGDPTTRPVFQSMKAHTNRTEINEDGWVEYYGSARPRKRVPWHIGLLQAANQSPQNSDVYLSDTLSMGVIENAFIDGATDKAGSTIVLPFDLDSSSPLTLRAFYATSGTDTGTFDIEISTGLGLPYVSSIFYTAATAPASDFTESTYPVTVTPTGVANQLQMFNTQFYTTIVSPHPENQIPDLAFMAFRRYGGADVNGDDFILVALEIEYVSWCDGVHL